MSYKDDKLSDNHRAMFCDHANEAPASCPCTEDCYCKEHTCKPKLQSSKLFRDKLDEYEERQDAKRSLVEPKQQNTIQSFEELGREVGQLVEEKNTAYGSSFDKCGDFLKLLFPDGVKPEQYTDMLCLVRVFDKLIRIATNKDAFGESPYRDLVGYGLLGLRKDLMGK